MAVIDDVRKKYPNLAFLLNDPEIGPMLRDAINPASTFSPQEFEARIANTRWWRGHSAAQRQWEFLRHTDPGEANSRISSYRSSVAQLASRLGVHLSGNEVSLLAVTALQNGWDPSSPELAYKVSQLRTGNRAGAGAIQTYAQQATQIAQGQYMIPISKATAATWGDWMARGLKTPQDFAAAMQKKAISRFPYLKASIQEGQTPEQIFAPHKDMIAQELELSPGSIDLVNSRWSKVLDVYDKQLGKHRPMTLYETQTLARQDERWWKTSKGKAADAGMANTVLQKFGKRK